MQIKKEDTIISVNTHSLCFIRDIHEGKLSSEVANELKDMSKHKISVQKKSFLNNSVLSLSAREKNLDKFKSKIFPIKI